MCVLFVVGFNFKLKRYTILLLRYYIIFIIITYYIKKLARIRWLGTIELFKNNNPTIVYSAR